MSKANWKQIGSCGVDSGQIMIVDPCYVLADDNERGYSYEKLIEDRKDHKASNELVFSPPFGQGVVTDSGHGDGVYPVYAKIEDGLVKEVKIKFS